MATETMVCLYCRKKIGLLRSLTDRSFCCNDHRKKLASKSARALREAEDLYGFDSSQVSWRLVTAVKPEEKTERRSGYGAAVFMALAVTAIVLVFSHSPGGGPAAKPVSTLPDINPPPSQGGMARMISRLLGTQQTNSWRDDFRSGLGNWEGLKSTASDWGSADGEVRPTSLRIWKPSTSLSNYELEFMGQIEHKSMDWAFRAADLKNYYATKLVITKAGPLPNAGLIRYIVLDGRERERVELPLPLTLERGVDYRVRVSVQGNHFLTSVNGQLISSWTDNILSRGGVGFFSDNGESALLKWVSVSERDSMLGRIASHFSLITFPTAGMAGRP
jgi:hypothetical protein